MNDEIEPGVVMGPAPGVPPKKTRYEFELTEEIGNEPLAYLARIKQQLGNDITKLGSLARHCDLIGVRWDGDRLIAEANVTVGLNFRDPVLVEKLNDLQWLDALCAQEFRNGESYVVQQGDQGQVVSVLGINNGQAFGSEIVDPDQLNHENGNDYFGCGLPDVISRQTADKILKLSSDELTQALSSLLKPAEIEACQARLLVIQKKIGLLNEAGKIIENSPWNVGSQGEENALFENVMTDSYRSYVARDADNRGYIKIDHQVFANGGANSKDSSVMTMEGLSDE